MSVEEAVAELVKIDKRFEGFYTYIECLSSLEKLSDWHKNTHAKLNMLCLDTMGMTYDEYL